MEKNIEIEFKTMITEKLYNDLIKKFELENNIYTQVNHYFDTPDLSLQKENTLLRIRIKSNTIKLTTKHNAGEHSVETHLFLNKEQADQMIENGFDASIIHLDAQVKKICELTTYRTKFPVANGLIFIDKSVFYGQTDYEIEYEADEYEQGKLDFINFLEEHDIPYHPHHTKKSSRAFDYVKK